MSASPGDAQPVFDLIVRRARELCNCSRARHCSNSMAIGSSAHQTASSAIETAVAIAPSRRMFPMAPTRGTHLLAGPFWTGGSCTSATCSADPDVFRSSEILGARGFIDTGDAVAARRRADRRHRDGSLRAGGFTDSQVELLQTFAEQAVIAISSAETYRELQERTAALAAAQQRIRRTDRAAGRDNRRAEGHVSLARRCATGIRADRRAGPLASVVQTTQRRRCCGMTCCICRRTAG